MHFIGAITCSCAVLNNKIMSFTYEIEFSITAIKFRPSILNPLLLTSCVFCFHEWYCIENFRKQFRIF